MFRKKKNKVHPHPGRDKKVRERNGSFARRFLTFIFGICMMSQGSTTESFEEVQTKDQSCQVSVVDGTKPEETTTNDAWCQYSPKEPWPEKKSAQTSPMIDNQNICTMESSCQTSPREKWKETEQEITTKDGWCQYSPKQQSPEKKSAQTSPIMAIQTSTRAKMKDASTMTMGELYSNTREPGNINQGRVEPTPILSSNDGTGPQTNLSKESTSGINRMENISKYTEAIGQIAQWKATVNRKLKGIEALLSFDLPTILCDNIKPIFYGEKEAVIGKGASGSVGLVKQMTSDGSNIIAMKVIDPTTFQKEGMSKYEKEYYTRKAVIEAKVLKYLSGCDIFPKFLGIMKESPYVLKIFMQFFGIGNQHFTMCEYFKQVQQKKSICPLQWLLFAHDIASGIKYMHERDLLHNDIAMRNIVLTSTEQRVCARIVDLGSVSLASSKQTRVYEGNFCKEDWDAFSKRYPEVAPEFMAGDKIETTATDIYALGVLFKEIGSALEHQTLDWLGGKMTSHIPCKRPTIEGVLDNLCYCMTEMTS